MQDMGLIRHCEEGSQQGLRTLPRDPQLLRGPCDSMLLRTEDIVEDP